MSHHAEPRPAYGTWARANPAPPRDVELDLCEWDPDRDRPAQGLPVTQCGRTLRWTDYTGCSNPMELVVGSQGEWRLCASCAALPRFRRFRRRMQLSGRNPK